MALLSPRRTFVLILAILVFLTIISLFKQRISQLPPSIALNIDFRSSFLQTYHKLTSHDEPIFQPTSSRVNSSTDQMSPPMSLRDTFKPGIAKPAGESYTRALIIPHTSTEDISWLSLLNSTAFPDLTIYPYVVNPPPASASDPHPTSPHSLRSPKNKGHEVMVYLTFLIDHYDALPDVSIFMHSHRHAWHNNDLLGFDALQHISRLSTPHVIRQGYFNLRCQWDPGCPTWIRPLETAEVYDRQEQIAFKRAYAELFPEEEDQGSDSDSGSGKATDGTSNIPEDLAQPCCGQFAVSRERIRSVPLRKLVWWRDWLLRTRLTDYVSGRVWEYSWQFVFTGRGVVCPQMRSCYCDAYGVCFPNEDRFQAWFMARYGRKLAVDELEGKSVEVQEKDRQEGGEVERDGGREVYLRDLVLAHEREMEEVFEEAERRGRDPRTRAQDCGREWREGDGF